MTTSSSDVAASQSRADESRRQPRASARERVVALGVLLAILVSAWALGLRYAHESTVELTGLVPVSFFGVGKFLPLWGLNASSNFTPWGLGLVIWAMDTCSVVFAIYSIESAYRFPPLRRGLDRVQTNAQLVLRAYPSINRAAVLGVIVFVLFPIAGTGAIGGTFLGILLGIHRYVLIAAVSAGGLLGGMFMAFAAVHFGGAVQALREMQQQPFVKYSILALLLALALLAFRQLTRAYHRALETAAAEQAATSE